jgi:hypothetical protein
MGHGQTAVKRLLCIGAILAIGAARIPEQTGDAAPELPVVAWSRGTVALEDFRGQAVAVVFYDDSTY